MNLAAGTIRIVAALAETVELRWIEPVAALDDPTLAELSRRHIMPRLAALSRG